jgi:hypothetical protein
MPIVYERAFGGAGKEAGLPSESRNPIGVGFQGVTSSDPGVHTHLPNIEYPDDRMTSPAQRIRPAGLGVIARSWQPRVALAGTYDDRWLAEQCPLVPLDFNPEHFQAAPADQQLKRLTGGEDVIIDNMTPEGSWRFRLPRIDVPLRACAGRRVVTVPMRMDTVLLEPDLYRVTVTSRSALIDSRNVRPVEQYVLGHSSPAWERARMRQKRFIDLGGSGGALRGAQHFVE